jgi:hypothetical protein
VAAGPAVRADPQLGIARVIGQDVPRYARCHNPN